MASAAEEEDGCPKQFPGVETVGRRLPGQSLTTGGGNSDDSACFSPRFGRLLGFSAIQRRRKLSTTNVVPTGTNNNGAKNRWKWPPNPSHAAAATELADKELTLQVGAETQYAFASAVEIPLTNPFTFLNNAANREVKMKTLPHVAAILLPFALVPQVSAHMAWLATDGEGNAILWFGESPSDQTTVLPESVAAIKLSSEGSSDRLKTRPLKDDQFVGLRSTQPVGPEREVFGKVVYGVYQGMKLTYHVEHLPHHHPEVWPTAPRQGAFLQTVITPTATGGVSVSVLSHGKPVADVAVKLYCQEGHEEAEVSTDATGSVQFSAGQVDPGLNALLIGIRNPNDAGTFAGEAYQSSADYLTATFFFPGDEAGTQREKTLSRPQSGTPRRAAVVPSDLPELPEELTSFGAAIAGDELYVYGGHTGEAHSYSTEEQSDRLWRLDLRSEDARWQAVSTDDHLQGLALVAWKDRVVRIGGFTALNARGEDHQLQSQSRVAVFTPDSETWSDLPSLPEGRSSFDAAVLDDKLYVVGGWQLSGDSDQSRWHDVAYSLDLSDSGATWQALPRQPFRRRALSVAAFAGKLYVLGGMNAQGGPTTRVDVFDPVAGTWSIGPRLPGGGMAGFGSSAFAAQGKLYVSTMDGNVHELAREASEWSTVAKTDPARFFHRMLPFGDGLLMIGGANMEMGKFTEIDFIKLPARE